MLPEAHAGCGHEAFKTGGSREGAHGHSILLAKLCSKSAACRVIFSYWEPKIGSIMLIGVGLALLAAVPFFSLGWTFLGVISVAVAAVSFWGFGVAANFRDDPSDMPNAAAILAVLSRPVAIGLLVIAGIGMFL